MTLTDAHPTARHNLPPLAWLTLLGATATGLYGLVNAWATVTSGVVVVALAGNGPRRPDTTGWPVAPGAELTWPYRAMVPVNDVPVGARWFIHAGQALTPLLWAASLAALGLLLLRAASAQSIFEPRVRRALNLLSLAVLLLALVPGGLLLLGTNWAVGSLGWESHTATDSTAFLFPLFVYYLCVVFSVTLRHGARLADELDHVI
ncbi:hypothetical protein [Propioniciclava soli]|uniref:hypothetical protein n=1 Tax=Propioniciclava soli TaxID=2775081 RepID=UPI001E2D4518|nr:hypothetical protein [Propioniciclava soli]